MSETKLPGSGGDLKPGSQSISPNHFTANTTASDNSAASQHQRILAWLMAGFPLSTQEARRELDCMPPGMRVCELRKLGYPIHTHWTTEETVPGRKHRMARYVLLIESGVRNGR